MSLQEILQALNDGKAVKWNSSRWFIIADDYGVLHRLDTKLGFTELLDSDEYDDCFI